MKSLLRPRQVYQLIGLSAMQVWRLRRDGRFPQPIALGVNSKAFVKEEVDAWIEARVAARDARQVSNQPPDQTRKPSIPSKRSSKCGGRKYEN